ncbi:MAG: M43 family zinc metalloprotease [Bacteroidetes bacterium]|nr:M43 family zinc metalloprotease [Bacteroidota bacterium]
MKILKSTLLSLAVIFSVMPFTVKGQGENHCGSDAMRKELITQHPEILQQEKELDAYTREFIANYHPQAGSRSATPFIIPLVFHVINQAGSENISDAQIYSEMKIMNDNWNRRNADTSVVIPSFKSLIGDMAIEYRLANRDPNGNVCTGIDRVYSVQTYMGNDYSKLDNWPRDKYMNVWVVRSMMDGVAGYAYYPGSVDALFNTPARDGVILLQNYIGAIGTGSFGNSRTLTHEIGHCFNLKHCWGDSNDPGVACGDDDANDTPVTKGWASCPSAANAKICTPGLIENYQNFMEYSYCSHMFSIDQTTRVAAALNSDKSDRNNLWTPANLAATGTDDTIYDKAKPIAEFGIAKRFVCVGQNAQFLCVTDTSEVDNYLWTFSNADVATSTSRNPIVQFQQPGWQTVSLKVANTAGDSTKTKTSLVFVSYDHALFQAPFTQDFEDPYVFSSGWASANYDNNGTAFSYSNQGAHAGTGCGVLNNYFANADHDIDEIVSPGYDLSQLPTTQRTLTFDYSWASASQSFALHTADSMNVFASTDCGVTWSNIYKKGTHSGTATLLNAGSITGYFTPTNAQLWWKQVSINLAAVLIKPNVMFRFQVLSAVGGNNFYIDNINIGSQATAIEDLSSVSEISIFPNPSRGDATLNLDLSKAGNLSVKVYDIQGKEVMNIFEGWLNAGEEQMTIEGSSKLSAGVYIVNVKAGDSVIQRKLVIQ